MRTVLVLVHAAPGVIGLLTGLWAMSPPLPADGRHRWRQAYVACVGTLVAGLVVLVIHDWSGLDAVARIAFTGLAGLAAVMGYRLWLAHQEASRQQEGWQERYLAHVSFTYVALWVGFLIVPAINSPLPQVTVPLVVVAVLVTGNVLIRGYKRGREMREENK